VIAFAPESQNIISFWKKKDMSHQTPKPISIKGKIPNVIFHQSSQDLVSVKNRVKTTQKITNNKTGKRINNNTVFF
jgi:hypothetical protein